MAASKPTFQRKSKMVGVEGFEPPRLSHLLPKQTRYQATVYTPLEIEILEIRWDVLESNQPDAQY